MTDASRHGAAPSGPGALTGTTRENPRALTTPSARRDDAALVRAFQRGESDAFTALYARHRPMVARQCRARLRDPHLAEEAMQETFARVLAKLPTFRGGARIRNYISRVARYVCIDLARERAGSGAAPPTDLAADTELEHACERRHSIRTVLAGVTPKQAALLRAHHLEDRPLDEIADELRSTPGSVAVMLHRARASARAVAEEHGIRSLVPTPLLTRLRAMLDAIDLGATGLSLQAAASLFAVGLALGAVVVALPPAGPNPVRTAARTEPAVAAGVGAVTDDRPRAATPSMAPAPGSAAGPAKRPGASDPAAPVVPLPEVAAPAGRGRIHQHAPEHPEHDYGLSVEAAGQSVVVGVSSDDSGGAAPVHEGACNALGATPVGYCERG